MWVNKTYEELTKEIEELKKSKKSQKKLVELEAELLRLLDSNWEYLELIDAIEEWKKHVKTTKFANNLALLAEIVDTMIPAWWILAWLSLPFTAWDFYFQHSLKEKIDKIYNLVESNDNIDLKLKHINPQSTLLVILDLLETAFELVYVFRRVSMFVLLIKTIIIIKKNINANNISKELDEIHDYLLAELEKNKFSN